MKIIFVGEETPRETSALEDDGCSDRCMGWIQNSTFHWLLTVMRDTQVKRWVSEWVRLVDRIEIEATTSTCQVGNEDSSDLRYCWRTTMMLVWSTMRELCLEWALQWARETERTEKGLGRSENTEWRERVKGFVFVFYIYLFVEYMSVYYLYLCFMGGTPPISTDHHRFGF